MNQELQTQYKIVPIKTFVENTTKTYNYGELMTTYPSGQFHISSVKQLNTFLEATSDFGTAQISGMIIPLKSAIKVHNALFNGKYKNQAQTFAKTKTLAYDFETEYWYFSKNETALRKKAFSSINDKPVGWEELYTIPDKSSKHKNWELKIKEYNVKISKFFSDDAKKVRLILSTMRFAKELDASIIMPPAPMIVNGGASLHHCLEVNEIFNKYRQIHNLPKTAYYPLHKRAMDSESILAKILKQIQELQPEILIIGTIQGEEFIFPSNKFDGRKHHFERFTDEIAIYARTTNSIVMWYDKGNYCSSYGFKLIKKGFDSFISPVKSNYSEGSFGSKEGLQFAYILNDYVYYKWEKYLQLSDDVPCEKECCKDLRREDIETMSPHQQWTHKQRHEVGTRNAQFEYLLRKLHEEGNLNDFEVRLARNKIS